LDLDNGTCQERLPRALLKQKRQRSSTDSPKRASGWQGGHHINAWARHGPRQPGIGPGRGANYGRTAERRRFWAESHSHRLPGSPFGQPLAPPSTPPTLTSDIGGQCTKHAAGPMRSHRSSQAHPPCSHHERKERCRDQTYQPHQRKQGADPPSELAGRSSGRSRSPAVRPRRSVGAPAWLADSPATRRFGAPVSRPAVRHPHRLPTM